MAMPQPRCDAVLQKFSSVRPHPEAFVEALEPFAAAAVLDLVVAQCDRGTAVADRRLRALRRRQRKRYGLASTFLAERINPGDQLKVYVQKATASRCRRTPARRSS